MIIHEDIYEEVKNRLLNAYAQVEKKIGNPLDPNTLVGPVIDKDAVEVYKTAIAEVKKAGGTIVFGDKVIDGNYVLPSFCEVENHWQIVQDESFVPVLYIMKYKTLDGSYINSMTLPITISVVGKLRIFYGYCAFFI